MGMVLSEPPLLQRDSLETSKSLKKVRMSVLDIIDRRDYVLQWTKNDRK